MLALTEMVISGGGAGAVRASCSEYQEAKGHGVNSQLGFVGSTFK